MACEYEELRSDVSEACEAFLDGSYDPSIHVAGHRFIKASIDDIEVMYDTLTTMIEFKRKTDDDWHYAINHDYVD